MHYYGTPAGSDSATDIKEDMMELKIYSPQDEGFLQEIKWNFEELKVEIEAAARDYETSVYTDETIKNAKADRAKLNRFVAALESKRTEIRRQLLKPDEQFGREVKELVGIVKKAIDNIDGQVKDYEYRQREEKTAKVRAIYEENIHDLGEYLPFEKVMRPEYANASTTLKSVREAITALIRKVDEGLVIINETDSKFVGDMKKVFLETYDIGAALAERNRLETEERNRELYMEEQKRRKAEREVREQAEAQRIMQAGAKAEAAPEAPEPQVSAQSVEEPIYEMRFCVHGTRDQILKLRDFMKNNNISFERI